MMSDFARRIGLMKRRRPSSPNNTIMAATNKQAKLETNITTKSASFTSKDEGHGQKSSCVIVTQEEIKAFFALLDRSRIHHFLQRDCCYKLSDKYLLAMVFAYFKRAKLQPKEFTATNFFIALYLANDMEEDDEDDKYEILLWALGDSWRVRYSEFMARRDQMWIKMNHRAIVSLRTCEEYISILPDHSVWQRIRRSHHAGANRYYGWNCEQRPLMLFGPTVSPPQCRLCFPPSIDNSMKSITSNWMKQNGMSGLPNAGEILEKVQGGSLCRSSVDKEE